MLDALIVSSMVAVVVLYSNTVTILKKIKNDEETKNNTVIGCVCSFIILMTIYCMIGSY